MEISKQMSAWAKVGRKNLREKLGEEGFRKLMSDNGKKGKGKSKPRKKIKSIEKNVAINKD